MNTSNVFSLNVSTLLHLRHDYNIKRLSKPNSPIAFQLTLVQDMTQYLNTPYRLYTITRRQIKHEQDNALTKAR
jgi:hypothetical protein